MPEHRNTDSESESLLDAADWDIVFQAYEEYPILAFILAQHFDCVKTVYRVARNGEQRRLRGSI